MIASEIKVLENTKGVIKEANPEKLATGLNRHTNVAGLNQLWNEIRLFDWQS